MQTVTKRELVQRIAEKTKVQQISAKEVIQSFLDEIINELAKGNRLEFRDFGVFEPKSKAQRVARNPRTGERVEVPEKTTVKFKVGRLMKKKIQPDDDGDGGDERGRYDDDDDVGAAPAERVTPSERGTFVSGGGHGGNATGPGGGAGDAPRGRPDAGR